jgi:hypothetical protein
MIVDRPFRSSTFEADVLEPTMLSPDLTLSPRISRRADRHPNPRLERVWVAGSPTWSRGPRETATARAETTSALARTRTDGQQVVGDWHFLDVSAYWSRLEATCFDILECNAWLPKPGG